MNPPAPSCNASGIDDDIWFKFTSSNAGGIRIELQNVSYSVNNSGITAQLYSGTCNGLAAVSCNAFTGYNYGDNFGIEFNAVAATDYYVRVFTPESDLVKFATVNACAYYLPPPPANDDCSGAISLTPNIASQCISTTAGTTIGATASAQASCTGANIDDDVWYKFIATSETHKIIVSPASGNGINPAAFEVLSGDCNTLSSLYCVTNGYLNYPAYQTMNNLTIGDTYYVRVYSYYDYYNFRGEFNICVSTPNDDCSSAETLTVNADANCTVITSGSTKDATQSNPYSFCVGSNDDDVWYKFTATSPSHKLSVTPTAIGGLDNAVLQIYSGDCSSLGSLFCVNNTTGQDPETITANGLIPGEIYFVRIFSYDSYTGKGDFTICVSSTNDDCINATTIIPNEDAACSQVFNGTTVGATQSAVSACAGFGDDDVWYKFVARHPTHKIAVTPTTINGIDNAVLQVFSGTCSALTFMHCVDNTSGASPEEDMLTGLTIGETYYFMVHSFAPGAGNGDFDVCISSYNSECGNPIVVGVNADNNCSTVLHGSTVRTAPSVPACAGNADDAVWYKFTATAANHIISVTPTATNGLSNAVVEILSSNCPNAYSLFCVNNTTGPGAEIINATGLTIGDDYFVAVYSYDNNAGEGEFDLCITTPTNTPVNDDCSGAIPLTVSNAYMCTDPIDGTNFFATGSLPNCTSQPVNNDVWYNFVAIGSSQTISVNPSYPNPVTDPLIQIFSGNCTSLNSLGCNFPNSALSVPTTPGQTYYARVYSNSGSGNFNICATTYSPVNDDCAGAVALPVNNDTTCTISTSGTSFHAGSSGIYGNCTFGPPDDDVWYKFVATSNAHIITATPATTGGINDVAVEYYDGTCGGSLSSYGCSNNTAGSLPESLVASTVAGTTYYVRVYSVASFSGQGAFSICIKSAAVNDNCSGAIGIPVNNNGSCTNTYLGTSVGASSSQVVMCGDGSPTDVWYKFVANAAAYNIAITPAATGGISNPKWDILSGDCANPVSMGCASNASTFENLVIGDTYFLRIASTSYQQAAQGAFTICIKSIPLANDICSAAVNVPVSNAETCITNVTGTTTGASVSQASGNKDVWYKFVATETSHKVRVAPTADSLRNVVFEVYSGNCGMLASLAYVDVYADPGYAAADSVRPEVQSVDGLIAGNTYYIRVFSGGVLRSGNVVEVPGSFAVCVSLSGNDACGGAVALTVNTDNNCSITTTSTSVAATQSRYGCAGSADDDVWFKFIATATAHKFSIAATATNGIHNPVVELFSGACNSLSSIRCSVNTSFTGNSFGQGNLIIGNTYFLRVYSNGSNTANQGAFTICVSTPNIPNDDCSNSIALTVNAGSVCTVSTTGTSRDATESQPGCSGSADDDVWYRFVATAGTHKIFVNAAASDGIQNPIMELFAGNCAGLTSLICNGSTPANNTVVQQGLIVGNTYYIRLYSAGALPADQGAFTICVNTPNVPNDSCNKAIPLAVNTDNLCTQTVTGTTVDATQSVNGCNATADDDVWYKFVATATSHRIVINSTAVGGIQYPVAELFSGACSSLLSLQCNGINTISTNSFGQGNLIIGNTYYLRVYSSGSSPSNEGAFTICVNTPNITNDDCSNATTLTVNADNLCGSVTNGTTAEATQSQASCNGAADDDVWYKFTATAATHKFVVTSPATGGCQSPEVQLFSGACSSLTSIRCNSAAAVSNNTFIQGSLVIGNTYYVRVYSNGPLISNRGTFSICVGVPVIPANNNCSEAVALAVNPDNNCAAASTGTTADASQSQIGCTGVADDDVWYSFTASAASHNILVNSSALNGIVLPVIEAFSGNCASLTSIKCNSTAVNNSNSMTLDNLIVGNTYYLRVYSNAALSSTQGAFSICVSVAPPGEVCETAILLTPSVTTAANYLIGSTSDFIATTSNNSCSTAAFNDVWYKFNVTSVNNIVKVIPTQADPTLYTTLYRGNCSGFVPVVCTTIDTAFSLPNLFVGEPILLRIHGFNQTTGNAYKIAVITDQAINDECGTAYNLDIAAGSNSPSQYHSNRGATQSIAACSGTNPANDVWYSLTAGSDSFAIEIDHLKINNINSQLFTGNCSALVPVVCQTTDNIITVSNPVAGQVYFLRLYSSSGAAPIGYFIKAYKKEALQKNTLMNFNCLYTNIAPNPGFENYTFCPSSPIGVATPGSAFIPGWFFPTAGTSDYYNSCSNFNGPVEIPRSCIGNQSPRAGKGYAGIVSYDTSGYREYLQAQLPAPMTAGKRYLLSYYVSLADMSQLAHNKLGACFSIGKVSQSTTGTLGLVPQSVSPAGQYFNNKNGWVNVSELVYADQAYQYFVIGNFNSNVNTTTVSTLNGSFSTTACAGIPASYLFIDDVSLSEVNETAVSGGCNGVLPLTLTNFDVIKNGNTSLLSWKTVYEINTSHFDIERSTDGINFYKTGSLAASQNTGSTIRSYDFIDTRPVSGANFYRLKMIDRDGSFKYSDIRQVNFRKTISYAVYPNPFNTDFEITSAESGASFYLTDAAGKTILKSTVNRGTQLINTSNIASGIYMILIEKGGLLQYQQKIIKQ